MSTFHSSFVLAQPTNTPLLPTGIFKLMQEIPYDVWRCIAEFLPTEDLKRLYSVNRAFLNISLDERYRVAYIGPPGSISTERNLNTLIDPKLTSRVRDFTFKPGSLCKLLDDKSILKGPSNSNTVTTLLNDFERLDIAPQRRRAFPSQLMNSYTLPVDAVHKNVLRIFKQMINLTSLRIVLDKGELRHFKPPSSTYFSVGWATFGSNLKSLDLRIPLEYIENVLPANGAILTNLQNLSLQIIRESITTDASTVFLEKILPFVNAHSSTLRSLSFDIAEQMDLTPVLQQIDHIHTLQIFKLKSIFMNYDQTGISGLEQFLQKHRVHLTALHLEIDAAFGLDPVLHPSFFAQHCFHITLPALRDLYVRFYRFPVQYSIDLIPFALQFSTTLQSLAIIERSWEMDHIRLLLDGLTSNSPLRELKLKMIILEASIIEAFASCLPNLVTLGILFHDIGPDGFSDPPTNTMPLFADEMRRLNFPTWRLRELNLVSPLHLMQSQMTNFKHALVGALPSVQRFCGLTPEEYLKTREFMDYFVEASKGF
ncbi:hypothetical protein JR316_0005805 [Psilocybe cubensis]|uniref:Uncharacterized protein n=2 Tax=Psilocybe cubensis TaxID=181762 RepID=A0ACB8H063_PSICU|nr:hypothetical protein JR316_0005805 [Psilocybe cubensis]KAH9481283.1 hypothetical protein JR316_0005805 [Psilocybe cubensis]